eukprot:1825489-Pleurochrysis_carterae.AAC.7
MPRILQCCSEYAVFMPSNASQGMLIRMLQPASFTKFYLHSAFPCKTMDTYAKVVSHAPAAQTLRALQPSLSQGMPS